MRGPLPFLMMLVAAAVAVFVLLPVLSVLFIVLLIGLALVVGTVLAAPLLAKLPWFRDRIFIRRWPQAEPRPNPATPADQGDVIDVEGREIPEQK
jgi:hypothetical protein